MDQRLKSLFLVGYILLAIITTFTAFKPFSQGHYFATLGMLMTTLPFLIFLATLYLFNIARTDPSLKLYSTIIGLGVLVLSYSYFTERTEINKGLGFFTAISWLLYLKWYSVFKSRYSPLLIKGNQLPELNLMDEKGNSFNTKKLIGQKNILMFYRGNWCPLCVTQIKELVQDYANLKEQNIQTVLISPQPQSKTKKLAERFKVDFKFLVDKDNKVARQLNIISENGLPTGLQVFGYDSDTVMPTVILTDESGMIMHVDLTSNYRVRPEPKELLKYFNT